MDLPHPRPTYVGVPAYRVSATLVVFALLAGPLIGLLATGYIRLIGVRSHHRPRGLASPGDDHGVRPSGWRGSPTPQLFGNGKDMVRDVLVGGGGTIGVLLALAVLKPGVTAACLGAGGSGGLFTPVMSTGAVLDGGLGLAWPGLADALARQPRGGVRHGRQGPPERCARGLTGKGVVMHMKAGRRPTTRPRRSRP